MRAIYADYNATWPVSQEHLTQATQELIAYDGNPSSIHLFGRKAKRSLEKSRWSLASFIGVSPQKIFFTSGATESNNLVVASICAQNPGKQILISPFEHASIQKSVELFGQKAGCSISVLSGTASGVTCSKSLDAFLTQETKLLCLSFVSSELGTITPVFELAAQARLKNAALHIHVDAVQALGKLDLSALKTSEIDSMSFSAHKIGGLKGIGALYLKQPLLFQQAFAAGGSQETGFRPGTENLLGAISFGLRAQELTQTPNLFSSVWKLTRSLYEKLQKIPDLSLHGDFSSNVGNTVNFHIPGKSIQELLIRFENAQIAVSAGTACSSGESKPSTALLALGLSQYESANSVRISLGVGNLAEDVERIAGVIRINSN